MCRKGDIYIAALGMDCDGHIQSGERPVIVVSNNKANEYSPTITVIPLTSKLSKKRLPTHVYIQNCGLSKPSIALAEQILTINRCSLKRKMGSIIKTVYEDKVKQAIQIQLSI